MSRIDRLFELVQILRRSRRAMTGREIAEALEVSLRTIYRDCASLQAMGVPVEGEAGVGYVMRRGYDLPPLAFTREEAEAVLAGLR
ncbi:MAG: HTH domain-containing protein, partial [Boseongicola sp. SB0667_bin_21]|nr:HTH domain-containing protein [Boseongicola sp. SB0667_bin_21]